MAYEPELVRLPGGGLPTVEVLFTSFVAGTATVSLFKTVQGREYLVRGGLRVATAGTLTRTDQELAYGVPMTYRAEMFDSVGSSLGFTGTSVITVAESRSFLFNPLDPTGAVAVTFRDSAASRIERPTPHEVSYPQGRRVGVVLAQPRLGVVGVSLDVVTDTEEDADSVSALLGGYSDILTPVICVAVGDGVRMRLPRPFFAGVRTYFEEGVDYRWGGSQIDHFLTADEVSPPAPGVFIPLLTRADLNAYYSSRGELNAAYASRLDVNRAYDLAGYAGG